MFQRRHYEFLADWLAETRQPQHVAATLADRLARDNPRFKRERFIWRASGGRGVKVEPARLAAE